MKLHLSLLFLFISIVGWSQKTVSINVIDANTKEPLAFANVYLKNNNIGTSTKLNGKADLILPKGVLQRDTLICSFISYETNKRVVEVDALTDLTIELKSKDEWVEEIIVKDAASTLTGVEIIEQTIKNIKKNYPRKAIHMDGFYRELTFEDDRCVLLGEAATTFYYTRYPQKRFVRKSFRQYYKKDYGYMNGDRGLPIFYNPQFFKYYNTVKDQCKIEASRLSKSWSKYDAAYSGVIGPLALTAVDKVKYLADFLDPKLVEDYEYKKQGASYVDGQLCFVISFKPRDINKRVWQQWNHKIRFPLFAGKIFIAIDDFAVVKFDCQFSKIADVGIYSRDFFFPDYIGVSVAYHRLGNQWFLKKVKTEQHLKEDLRTIARGDLKHTRELFITGYKTGSQVNAYEKDDPSLFKDMQHGKLRSIATKYDEAFWKVYILTKKYIPLNEKHKKELEARRKLDDQYKNQFIQQDLPPPFALSTPDTILTDHGLEIDSFSWLENTQDSKTIAYLEEERIYFDNFMIPFLNKKKKAYQNIVNKINFCDTLRKKTERKYNIGYDNISNYGVYKINKKGKRENILRTLDRVKRGFQFITYAVSPQEDKIAYIIKEVKSGKHILKIESIKDKNNLTIIEGVDKLYWFNNQILLYSKITANLRPYSFSYYDCVEDQTQLLFETSDDLHELEFEFIDQEGGFYLVESYSNSDNSIYAIAAKTDKPTLNLLHDSATFFSEQIRLDKTKWLALAKNKNTAIYETALNEAIDWSPVLEAANGELFDEFLVTKNYYLIKTINKGIVQLFSFDKKTKERKEIVLPEKHHSISLQEVTSYSQNACTIIYSSPNIPFKEIEIKLANNSKTETALFCFNDTIPPPPIISEILMIPTHDEKEIPLVLSYSSQTKKEKKGLILMAYGAYGAFVENDYDEFSNFLMEEGYTIAQAHIRGTRAQTWAWYEAGKLLNKKNSFEDYLSCARYLIDNDYTDTSQLFAYGQSAGGLVVGAAINKEPQLFKTAVLDYPYLDVLNTMLRDSLVLTTLEYTEWGNPKEKQYYDYIQSYSPYQNIKKQTYPNILLLTGMKDFQTPYWQSIKSIAKYRQSTEGEPDIISSISPGMHPGFIPYEKRMLEMVYIYLFIENIK